MVSIISGGRKEACASDGNVLTTQAQVVIAVREIRPGVDIWNFIGFIISTTIILDTVHQAASVSL